MRVQYLLLRKVLVSWEKTEGKTSQERHVIRHLAPFTPTSFGPFGLIQTKITSVKPPPDNSPDQTAEPWSDENRWP